jgi:DNA-binding transcriptional ArsR family regulator
LETGFSKLNGSTAHSFSDGVGWRSMNDDAAAKIAKALSHPLRIELLRTLRGRAQLSPVEYARESSEPLGNISYHVTVLREAGVIAVADTIARRGAMEHRYALKGRRAKTALAVLDLLGEA